MFDNLHRVDTIIITDYSNSYMHLTADEYSVHITIIYHTNCFHCSGLKNQHSF